MAVPRALVQLLATSQAHAAYLPPTLPLCPPTLLSAPLRPPARPPAHSTHSPQELLLRQMGLPSAAGVHVAQALTALPALMTLNLSENALRAEGLRAVAEALGATSSLTALDLSSNQLTRGALKPGRLGHREEDYDGDVTGVSALAQAVAQNRSLQALDLSCNCIGGRVGSFGAVLPFPRAAQSLLAQPGLADSATLVRVVLSDNNWSDHDAELLRQALANTKVELEIEDFS